MVDISNNMDFDWQRILFSDQEYSFFWEILLRTPLMFLAVVIVLKFTGKRGVQQLSIFEMVMIITLGSAAGDSMFYEDVGLLHAVAVFILVLAVYRVLIWLITKFEWFELLIEGKPIFIIREGKMCLDELNSKELGSDEFFGTLRGQHVDQLGQVKYAVLEDTGSLSVFYFPDDEVLPGLPILPDEFQSKSSRIVKAGLYACAKCGRTYPLEPAEHVPCQTCKNREWVEAVHRKRIG
jgi:uncharacterized membrane protein YcaP (DUF421 family)